MTTMTVSNNSASKILLGLIFLFILIFSVYMIITVYFEPSNNLNPQPETMALTIQYNADLSNIYPTLGETSAGISSTELRIIQLVNGHAFAHGEEVNASFRCLDKNGTWKSFKSFGFKNKDGSPVPTNIWICRDDDGSFYAIVTTAFEKIMGNNVARLITAYKIAADLFPTVQDYINYIGLKWSAREIQYVIGVGETILEPFKP